LWAWSSISIHEAQTILLPPNCLGISYTHHRIDIEHDARAMHDQIQRGATILRAGALRGNKTEEFRAIPARNILMSHELEKSHPRVHQNGDNQGFVLAETQYARRTQFGRVCLSISKRGVGRPIRAFMEGNTEHAERKYSARNNSIEEHLQHTYFVYTPRGEEGIRIIVSQS
jgi:hypothetical protein